ncbi:DNA adenine methylase [Helicobacter sp. 13S00477-4]|uniref:DNA adenine methylase n=1 Tax=Helicobacter sp. 13S00477-4 TaxID=1905759 RepID=UPI000BA7DD7F|nr:DNA adenine methylase [Helicobacter sp. 13S00477-4]PAF52460.1 restriction endonuclease [Helicobacter sp. 13S00477-4]
MIEANKNTLFFDETNLTYFERKKKLLESLRGKANPYKRYCGSPIRYGGGKSLAVGFIIEYFPDSLNRVISPFMGGGSVEIACALELGLEVKAYDIFDILVNFWKVLLKDSEALYKELSQLEPTKQVYQQIKIELKNYWNKEIVLDSMKLARDYYFNFNLSYGPGFLGWMSSIYEDKSRYLKALEKIKNFYLPNLSVECASFEMVFGKYPNDFFYLDPPYFLDGDSKMFKGIYPQRNFPIHHNGFDHQLLADLLHRHKGKFILSYNDCGWVRETYRNFKILEPQWQYTMGQGETRIGKNRIQRGDIHNIKKSHELLIIKE